MAAPSTFSYAQAAKGTAPSPVPSNPAAQEAQPAADNSDAVQAPPADVSEPAESVDAQPAAAVEKQEVESAPGSEIDARSESTRRSESRRDDDTSRLDRPWRRSDKSNRSSSTTARSADEQDSRKARRGKKTKASEKQGAEQAAADKEQEAVPEPKIELSEAPIPSVNIWHQRKEAHQAKKPSAEEMVNGTQDAPKTDGPAPAPITNGVKPQRKAADAPRPERNGPRGSRVADKDGKGEIPPPVEDAASWPTPEIAIKEEKKKPAEKTDRPEKEVQDDSKPRSKEKWVAYDYVPTVSFETQLPQMRNSKPRGGARGARDATTRTAGNGVQDKASTAATVSKATETKPREANGPNGATPAPATSKRGSLDAANGQKKASTQTNAEKAKDSNSQSTENSQSSRERPEGRNERGRGGFRGRGAHVNSQAQHSGPGAANFAGQASGAARTQGPYSPPLRQGAHGQMFAPPTQRGRGGRNGAGNYHRMSLPNGSSRIPAVQAQFGPYEYPIAPMAGMPFQPHPYWDNMVLPMLRSQIEYYFSIENLCKDMYLRQRMDSQGFVPLHFIAAFKRMRDLSPDINLIRSVCEDSIEVEFVLGDDDCERLRRREHWQKFVLPMEDRDELARNAGPAHFTYKNRAYAYPNQFNGMPAVPYGVSPAGYPTNPSDPAFQQFAEGVQVPHGTNDVMDGAAPSQLSAEVPDFAPSGALPASGLADSTKAEVPPMTNGHVEAAPTVNGVHAEEQASQS